MDHQTLTISLILIAALMHATWNTLVKSSTNGILKIGLITIFMGIVAAGFIPWVEIPTGNVWYIIAASIFVHLAYAQFLTVAYKHGDLSLVYPIARGSGPLFIVLFSALLVGESLSFHSLIGVGIISLGVTLLSLKSLRTKLKNEASPLRPVVFALLTGASIATYTTLDGLGVRQVEDPFSYIVYQFVAQAISMLIFCLILQPKEFFPFTKNNWGKGLAGGLMGGTGYAIVVWAMSGSQIYFVAALRETSVVFAAIIGALFLGESFGRFRFLCALLVASGVVILKLGIN